MTLSIERLDGPFGVEIAGVALRETLDAAIFGEIEQAFETHGLVILRGQPLTDEEQLAFSRYFGPLEQTVTSVAGVYDEVADLSNVNRKDELIDPKGKRGLYLSGNQRWHTDSSFKRVPAKASLLSGREVPPEGGETEFADMRLAYEALPREKAEALEGLVAEHSFAYSQGLIAPDLLHPGLESDLPPVPQALIRTHPATGRKSLYVGRHASHILGMDLEAGRALLTELLEFATQPQFTYRHSWQANDLVIWDNRCMLHRGRPWDEARYRRVMHRTTVAGDGPTA